MIGITGATGFVGMFHLASLLKRKQRVKILIRENHPLSNIFPKEVIQIKGSLSDLKSLDAFSEGLSSCFHYAARANFRGNYELFKKHNIDGTQNLVDACKKVDRFIFCSSQSSILRNENRFEVTESFPYPINFLDLYGYSKSLSEKYCLEHHPGATVTRPTWIWGAGDTNNLAALIKPQMKKLFFVVNNGNNWVETSHVSNFIYACELAAQKQESKGKIYFVTDQMPIPYKKFCQQLFASSKLSTKIPSIPYAAGKILAHLGENFFPNKIRLSHSALSYMSKHKTFSDKKIRTELGHRDLVSRYHGMKDLAAWVRFVGGAQKIGSGRRHGKEKELVYKTFEYLMERSTTCF